MTTERNRDEFVNLPYIGGRARVNEAEKRALEAIAQLEQVKISEAIRLVIREAAKIRGLWSLSEEQWAQRPK